MLLSKCVENNRKKGDFKMKRSFLVLLSVLLVFSFVLAGCGSKEPKSAVEGTTWNATGGKDVSGIEVTAEQLGLTEGNGFTLEFKEKGALSASLQGETTEGTWSEKDNVVTMVLDGESATADLADDKLTLVQGDMTLYFEKQ